MYRLQEIGSGKQTRPYHTECRAPYYRMDLVTTLTPLAIKLASNYFANKTSGPAEMLAIAAAANDTHDTESLLKKNPSVDRIPALVAASAAGQIGALDVLFNTPASSHSHQHHHHQSTVTEDTKREWLNTQYSGTTPLLEAVKGKHAKTTDFLLESGADPNLHAKKWLDCAPPRC